VKGICVFYGAAEDARPSHAEAAPGSVPSWPRGDSGWSTADAIGMMGTLDETFEVPTWAQRGLHRKPVGALDVEGYWAVCLPLRR
jgi:hypothetical protein